MFLYLSMHHLNKLINWKKYVTYLYWCNYGYKCQIVKLFLNEICSEIQSETISMVI